MPHTLKRVEKELGQIANQLDANREERDRLEARRALWMVRGTECVPKPASYRAMATWAGLTSGRVSQILESMGKTARGAEPATT